jgi:autophagy-related protein 9
MAGNLFSRFAGKDEGRSFYEQIGDDPDVDIENRAGLALDEENLTHQFHDDEIQHAGGLSIDDSRISVGSVVNPARDARRGPASRGRQDAGSRWLAAEEDGDNEVPASLLVEPHANPTTTKSNPPRSGPRPSRNSGLPGPSTRRNQAQWDTAQAQQRLHQDEGYGPAPNGLQSNGPARRLGLNSNPKEKAMFRWANVSNLDAFTNQVYDYYLGAGLWCILLERLLHLLYVFLSAFTLQ